MITRLAVITAISTVGGIVLATLGGLYGIPLAGLFGAVAAMFGGVHFGLHYAPGQHRSRS
jgi:hypothetical protein